MKVLILYAAVALAFVIAGSLLLFLVYPEPDARNAVLVSATIALLVQVAAFALLRRMRGPEFMNAWMIGMIGRIVVLAAYGLIVLRTPGLAFQPALVSLALFFVICTFIEPFLLER